MTATPVVHVIDDDEALRDSIRMFLVGEGLDVRTYESADRFLDTFDPAEAGCVVTDVRMPGMSGLDLMAEIASRGLALPVIMLTGHADVSLAVRAMKNGAIDLLEKPFQGDDLIDAVRRALALGRSSSQVGALSAREAQARAAGLTPREVEVLDRLVRGQPNKTIAREIGISPRTVEVHRAKVMRKTQAKSLSELIRMFVNLKQD